MVSLTHGRPAMISQDLASSVPLPLTSSNAKPDEYGRLTEGSFFVKSVELYEITHRVICDLYAEPGFQQRCAARTDKQDENLAIVMQLDSAMMAWEEGLPKFLVISDPDVAMNDVSHRQAVILYIRLFPTSCSTDEKGVQTDADTLPRFLHARMLLLRPIVARVCLPQQDSGAASSRSPDSLQSRVMQQCTVCCVDIARNTISMLLKYQAYDGTVGLLPAWWYRVYYLFSAATILIAAKLRTDIFDPQDINHTWSEVMKVLEAHEHVSQSARRCVAALQILSSKILQSAAPTNTSVTVSNTMPSMPNNEAVQTGQTEFPMPLENSFAQFPDLDIRDLTFTVDDFSWLNDMNAWNVLNDT